MRAPTLSCHRCEVLWSVQEGWACWVCGQGGVPTVYRQGQDTQQRTAAESLERQHPPRIWYSGFSYLAISAHA